MPNYKFGGMDEEGGLVFSAWGLEGYFISPQRHKERWQSM